MARIELYVFDKELNLLGMIDSFTSLLWTRRYNTCGEFELNCDLTKDNLALLQEENIIYKKDTTECGVISYIDYKLDIEVKEVIVCKGKFATTYLSRRIALGTSVITGTSENTIRTLVTNNIVSPTNSDRIKPNLSLGADNSYTDAITYTLDNKELLEDITNLATLGELGFRTDFSPVNKTLTFNIYKGLDRSINQSVNNRAIFSKEFENILEQEYTDSLDNYKNVAYDLTTNVGNATGTERYEMFAEKDLEMELSKRLKVTTFTSKVNLKSNIKYKTDFNLGDIVTIISKPWGITLDTRITEIEEVMEIEGLQINVTFGNAIPTLITKIKQLIK